MKYNNLGKSGLKVSELSFGSWLTFGSNLDSSGVRKFMRRAFDLGVNFFDNAEGYAKGEAESLMGKAIKDYRREDIVISTKLFWGGNGPNDTGLSWKRIIEGTTASLKRMGVEYVDLLYCHRFDPTTPVEETVRAMNHVIDRGYAFYWGTSEWSAEQIQSAFEVAEQHGLIPPTMEQPQYNLLSRNRVEREYATILREHRLGLTIWSPLASGILSGKYLDGIPKGSRLEKHEWLRSQLTPSNLAKVKKLAEIAKSLDVSLAQLSIAWCLRNPFVNTVILGATTLEQLEDNLQAANIKDRITDNVAKEIDKVFE